MLVPAYVRVARKETSMVTPAPWVGIDVGKERLDVALRPGSTFTIANTTTGWAELVRQFLVIAPAGIVLEATGPYHRGVTAALTAAGFGVAVLNPAWTKAFARSEGRRAKTDRTDAQLLARYGQQKQPPATPLPTATARQLAALVAYRDDLVGVRTMAKNRVGVADPLITPLLQTHLAHLAEQVTAVERQIAALIASDPFWSARVALLTTVPGLSHVLAPVLAVGLSELGELPRRQLASLAGVAPHPQESGNHKGHAVVSGGRPAIRRALYLMAVTATHRDPAIKAHYQQLCARGKLKKVALVACARRMLGIINAMVREGLTWQQTKVGQEVFLPKAT